MATNKVVALNLGPVTSYGLAKSKGFPGTEEAWVQKLMDSALEEDVDALDEKIDDLDTKVDTQVETINATIEQEVGAVDTKADGIAANLTTLSGVVAQKIDTEDAEASFVPVPTASGAQGDALRNNGDGTTAWAPIGLPTDEQTGTAINAWLTAHPEATTTVQDGAITRAKLITDLQEKTDLAQNATAPAFDATVAYAAGAHVTYGGKLYVLPSGHEANVTWADTTKTEVNLGGEVADLKSASNTVNQILDIGAGANKWNPSEQETDQIVSNQQESLGELTYQNGYKTSDFIVAKKDDVIRWAFSNTDVAEGTSLTVSANAYRIAEYDASKRCLLVTASWIALPYTVQNASTEFIRVSATSKPINCIIIGEMPASGIIYEPYVYDSQRIAEIESELSPIGSVVQSAVAYRNHSRNWFDVSAATTEIKGDGKEYYYSDYIPVTEGEILYPSYSFNSYSAETMTAGSFQVLRLFDENKNSLGNSSSWLQSYTVPSGVAYVRCYPGYTDYAKIMIEKNTQTLEWEAYWDSGYIAKDPIARENVDTIYNSFLCGSVGMFDKIGAIGDSFTAGYAKASDGSYNTNKDHTYIGVMAKRAGIDYAAYGQSGATTRSYIADKLPAVLADTACDFYFLALGINDVGLGTSYIGTVADINDSDYTQNADTFCGNYGKIIAQVKEHAPKALFCLIKIPICGTNVKAFDHAIDAIGEHYNIPVINPYDDDFFKSAAYENSFNDNHPTLVGYTGMALAYERLLSKAIYNNPLYFKFATIG